MQTDVVVIGQIARDLVLRIPETPDYGDSAPVRYRREMLGGKGANQAVGMAQLGATVGIIGAVGADRVGTEILEQARRDGINTEQVMHRDHAETALIVDVVDDHARWRYFEHIPDDMRVTGNDINAAQSMIEQTKTLVLQLRQPTPPILEAAWLARAAGARVVLDGAPPAAPETRAALLADADVLRADAGEAETLAEFPITTTDDAALAAERLLRQGPGLVVLEVAGAGNVFMDADGPIFIPHTDAAVSDTTGGGDALVAGLTTTLTRGGSTEQSAQLAMAAAGTTVEHPGGRPDLTSPDLTHHLEQLHRVGT